MLILYIVLSKSSHFLKKKVNVVKWEVKVPVVDTDSELKETKKTGYGIPKLDFLWFAFTLDMWYCSVRWYVVHHHTGDQCQNWYLPTFQMK